MCLLQIKYVFLALIGIGVIDLIYDGMKILPWIRVVDLNNDDESIKDYTI